MAFEENKANLRLYFVFIVVIAIIRVIITQETVSSRDPLNSFTVLHFFTGFTGGILFNNPLVAFIAILAMEVWEIVFCFNIGWCFPSEVAGDTLNDIVYGFLGYLIGIITFKPKEIEGNFSKQLMEGFIIFVVTLLLMLTLSEVIEFFVFSNA